MKHNIFWRTMRRQPVRNGILLLLVALMSAVFVSRGAEYIWIREQVSSAEEYYRTVGTITPLDFMNFYVTEAAPIIKTNPYIDHTSPSVYASGRFEGMQNPSTHTTNTAVFRDDSNARGMTSYDIMLYGTVQSVTYQPPEHLSKNKIDNGWNITHRYKPTAEELRGVDKGAWIITLLVDQVECGYDDYVEAGQEATIRVYLQNFPDYAADFTVPVVGQRYFLKVFYEYMDAAYKYDLKEFDIEEFQFFRLSPFFDGRWLLPVEDAEQIDWDAAENETLRMERETLDYLIHAVSLHATADMTILPAFQEVMQSCYLTDGRLLNYEDHMNSNPVCVISTLIADLRGVDVGDTITVTAYDFSDTELYLNGPNHLTDGSGKQKLPLELEVVGIYAMAGAGAEIANLSHNYVWLPLSLLPQEFNSYGEEICSGTGAYGFVLTSPLVQTAFEESYAATLEELGYKLMFVENNFQKFYGSAQPMLESALISFVVFCTLLILTFLLINFLYLWPRQRELAILQALGVSRKKAAWQLVVPMLCVGGLFGCVGGTIGWMWSQDKAAEMMLQLESEYQLTANISWLWLPVLLAGVILILAIPLWLITWPRANRPVLEQMQGRRIVRNVSNYQTQVFGISTAVSNAPSVPLRNVSTLLDIIVPSDTISWKPMLRLTKRYLSRSYARSILSALVAVAFILTLGFMTQAIKNNMKETERLYNDTIVEMDIYRRDSSTYLGYYGGGFIERQTFDSIIESGFIKDVYWEATSFSQYISPHPNVDTEELELVFASVRSSNDIRKMVADHSLQITFADGWDIESFEQVSTNELLPLIVPESVLAQYQIELNDVFPFTVNDSIVVGSYTTDELGFENYLTSEDWLKEYALKNAVHYGYAYDRAEFTIDPAKNRELDTLYALTDSLVETGGIQPLHFQYWDEELTSVVRPLEQSLQLLNILYPVVMVVSILIAIGLQVILLIQQLRTAALLRVLGVPVSQTGGVLTLLQLPAVVLGLVLGLGILLILYRTCDPVYAAMYLGGSLAGILLGLIRMAKQQPLELLHVKE